MNKIKPLRVEAHLTQSAMAKAINRSQGAIAHYEGGRRIPDLSVCREIVCLFNRHGIPCSLDDVFPPKSEKVGLARLNE